MFSKIRSKITLNNGVLLIALLVAGSWAWGTVGAIQQNFVLQQDVDGLAQQIDYQELENQTLKFENQYFGSREYLELSAREHLNKANPGEKMLVLPQATAHDTPAATQAVTPIVKRSNFQQWMYFLFGSKT